MPRFSFPRIRIPTRGTGVPQRRRKKFILAPLLLAALFIVFQYFTAETYINPETGVKVRVALSPNQEAALGLQSFRQIISDSKVINSGAEVEMVREVARRLIAVVDKGSKNFDWSVVLIQDEQKNAFCLPGGKIAVYTGILEVTKNNDGLAAVMGHEIAHATARHGAQRLLQQNLMQAAMLGVSGSTREMEPTQRRLILGVLGAGAKYGVTLPYGREHETEADEIGLLYLIRAGYRPEAAIEFWQRMEDAGGRQPPEWASTHPSHNTRITRLKRLVESYRRSNKLKS